MNRMYIGGRWVAGRDERDASGRRSVHGDTFAQIARGGAHEVDQAVAAARTALGGAWGRMNATERGRVMMNISQRGARQRRRACADRGARHRQADDDSTQRHHRAGALLRVLRRRRRQGAWRGDSVPERPHGDAAARAARRHRAHHPVELPGADARPHRRAGARDGQRRGAEARRGHQPVGAALRRDRVEAAGCRRAP